MLGYIWILPILFIIASGFFIVKQQTIAVVERLGKFTKDYGAGFNFKIPVIDKVVGRVSLRIQQLDVIVETKTKDDVFVHLKISVQYQIQRNHVYDAFYKLQNPQEQITAFIFDTVRAEVPKMKLDDVFVKKEEIAVAIQRELKEAMLNYGYDIVKALVTDIDPDENVKIAMNRINAAEREKVAAQHEGDAQRILIVERAKAEAESKRLQGRGIADQRREIARGLEESMVILNRAGINSQEASALIIVTQHYDTLQSIGSKSGSNLILLPNNPNAASNMLTDVVTGMVAANKLNMAKNDESDNEE
ncbi:MAG: SPFH domain-containing protein [Flavobacteriaceae bacterium]